jgi:hypothetical protein
MSWIAIAAGLGIAVLLAWWAWPQSDDEARADQERGFWDALDWFDPW